MTPSLGEARVVMLGDDAALLQLPLALAICEAAAPDRLGFLVSIVFVQTVGEHWRIQGLLATRDRGVAP